MNRRSDHTEGNRDIVETESLASSKILVVTEDRDESQELVDLLDGEGYERVRGIADPRETLYQRSRWKPDLIILDLDMDTADPVAVLRELQDEGDEGPPPPIVVLTSGDTIGSRREAVEGGAAGLVRKPVDALDLALEVRSHLMIRALSRAPATAGEAQESADREVARAQMGVLHILARLVEYRDFKTERHSERVGELSARIAAEMGLEDDEVELIRDAAPLHDVGMVVVPDHILLKEGELSDKERRIMMTHAANGARILSESELPVMQLASTIAHTHHERWDGKGYPRGLEGEGIPLPGRIVAAADTFEAITHDRPFREAESAERALEEIREERGGQFDPEVVDALLSVKEREPEDTL